MGSSTVLTEASGNAYQLFLNLPFGETMAEQRRSSFETPYKFNGKELDANTGLYYYGARYYNPRISNWLSVDPLAESTMTPYQYTYQNPINLTDPTGMVPEDIIIRGKNNSSITIKTDLIDISVDASSLVGDLGGNYTFQGDDILVAGLDIVGIFDPTGVADIAAGSIEMKNGNFWGGLASYAGVAVGIGDLAKTAKIPKHLKTIEKAIDGVKDAKQIKNLRQGAVRNAWKQEKALIESGSEGTRNWTKAELKELKETGKVKGYQGHHINNVKHHPEQAGNPNNVEFLNKKEHLQRHNGNYRNKTTGEFKKRN